jgi:hypothetical protein
VVTARFCSIASLECPASTLRETKSASTDANISALLPARRSVGSRNL